MYIPYSPLSNKGDESTFAPTDLTIAQQEGFKNIPKKILLNWDQWVADQLNITQEELFSYFSSEQIDSIGINILNFLNGNGFIIADETGIGKGRILSGICRWGIVNNKKILFFTEREDLFTDFWRDLNDTNTLSIIKNPILLHPKSSIYSAEDKKVILKGQPVKIKKYFSEGFPDDCNLILTNYSQVNLKSHLKLKLPELAKFIKNNIIILDESHNASGKSNANLFLSQLLNNTRFATFSSATYLKDESQLSLYEKVIDFHPDTINTLKRTLKQDNNLILRKTFTLELTKKLHLLRREHEPIESGWFNVTVELNPEREALIDHYSNILNECFHLIQLIAQNPALKNEVPNHWFSMGATINRLSRNLILILKAEHTADIIIQNSIKNNHKAVIVIDSTFNSIINKTINHQKEVLKKEKYDLNFSEVLQYILYEVVGVFLIENKDMIEEDLFNTYENLLKKTSVFKKVPIAVIDKIKEDFNKHNISVGEISGRKEHVINSTLTKLSLPIKQQTTYDFNSGNTDVVIITRSGASGTSLHASATFQDQRVRDLYELEITTRPTDRVQFIGRVNRKNQVHKPRFFAITTNLAFEQRILNAEQQKLEILQTHISGDKNKLKQTNIYPFYTDFCDYAAFIYLKNQPQIAYQMGISLKNPGENLNFIDSILKRSIVLDSNQQKELYHYLICCTIVENKQNENILIPKKINLDNLANFWHKLSKKEQIEFSKLYKQKKEQTLNSFDYNWVGIMKNINYYNIDTINYNDIKIPLIENRKKKDLDKDLKKIIQTYKKRSDINPSYTNNHITPFLNKLQIGSQIEINSLSGKIFGIVFDFIKPETQDYYKYPNLFLIHIKTVNPTLIPNCHYYKEDFYITIEDLVLGLDIKLHNIPIQWNIYNRKAAEINASSYSLVGNPVYIEFLRQAYNIGTTQQININNKQLMTVLLPQNISIQDMINTKKPVLNIREIGDILKRDEKIQITTSWQKPSVNNKPTLILDKQGYQYTLNIANEIINDNNFINPVIKRILGQRKGVINGYNTFSLPAKNLFKILYLLEEKGVIWFY